MLGGFVALNSKIFKKELRMLPNEGINMNHNSKKPFYMIILGLENNKHHTKHTLLAFNDVAKVKLNKYLYMGFDLYTSLKVKFNMEGTCSQTSDMIVSFNFLLRWRMVTY